MAKGDSAFYNKALDIVQELGKSPEFHVKSGAQLKLVSDIAGALKKEAQEARMRAFIEAGVDFGINSETGDVTRTHFDPTGEAQA